jgi:hypothetical protein
MKQYMAMSVLFLVTFLLSACDGGSKKEDKSFDQKMYTSFQSEVFSAESLQETVYIESTETKDTITLKSDGTVYLKLNFSNGYYRSSVPNKLYITMDEYLTDSVALGTKDLSPSDSKKIWDDRTNESLKQAKNELIDLKCSLDVYGINLMPAGDVNVTKGNGGGQTGELFFDIVELRGVPAEPNEKRIPKSFHESVCSKENIKIVQDKLTSLNKDKEFFSFDLKYKFLNWFSFIDGDSFILSRKAKLIFNSMTKSEIKSSGLIFQRKK